MSVTTQVSQYQKKHSRTHIHTIINHPLSDSSIYYEPLHPPCSIYMLDSLFVQPLSKSSLVWNLPLYIPPNHSLLFATHHNLFCCSTKIMSSNLSLFLISTWNSIFNLNVTHLSDDAHLPAEVLRHFVFLQARSHYFADNCCTVSLSLPMIYPY